MGKQGLENNVSFGITGSEERNSSLQMQMHCTHKWVYMGLWFLLASKIHDGTTQTCGKRVRPDFSSVSHHISNII